MTRVRLHEDDLVALAEMIVERLAERALTPVPPRLLDAHEVAARLGVSAEWARENADRLGAVRLGEGPRSRLRFDSQRVAEAFAGDFSTGPKLTATPRPGERVRKTRSDGNGCSAGLLPIRTLNSRPKPRKEKAAGRANGRRSATRSSPSPSPQPTPDHAVDSRARGGAPRISKERRRDGSIS